MGLRKGRKGGVDAYRFDCRLASLGREAGQRIIALQMLRNAQTANLKVSRQTYVRVQYAETLSRIGPET